MESYVLNNLVKYDCFDCHKDFILSEYQVENSTKKIICPYCYETDIENYVFLGEDVLKKKRNRQLLVNIEERQLVLNSVVINRYPKFKKVLQKYRNISKKYIVNNEDFDDELRNLISFVFTGIKEEAETEWRGTGDVVIIDYQKA